MSKETFENLFEMFLKFPGVGPRQAKRFAYFLAASEKKFAEKLAAAILEVKKNIRQCGSCFRWFQTASSLETENKICGICRDNLRDKNLVMVVEKDMDLENIEKTGVYKGRYFVLGGILPLNGSLDENGKKRLERIKALFEKIKKEKPREVIIATGATVEGENTAKYIQKILDPLKESQEIKITRLGKGISTGTELEYIDNETMANALKNRA